MTHRSWLLAIAIPAMFAASSCSSDSTTTTETGGDPSPNATDADSEEASSDSEEASSSASAGGCPSDPFTGTVSSDGDDDNEAFSYTDSDIVFAQAYALAPDFQYTVYLADYEITDQEIGSDTIEADAGQVVITMQARHPDGEEIEIGEDYAETFVIMDSGGGAEGSPDEPEGTVTFIEVSEDRICFDVAFEDPGIGQELNATINAEVIE